MNKRDLAQVVYENTKITRAGAKDVVDALVDSMANALISGESISMQGFGALVPVTKAARTCRNPITGDPVEVPEKRSVKFKPSLVFKGEMNE